ncbi:MAG: NAD-dependent protein deacetylase [Pseudohongiellaceae bacterium]|nr:NAD-dependent protein deacetylase [Pseudohongiellaceae bacterium]
MSEALAQFIEQTNKLIVMTGAGLSTTSGIPAYRDKAGTWLRTSPIQHHDFINKKESRQRYWARSMKGWPLMHGAKPNKGHAALFAMEQAGLIELLITQNVDCLHQEAGHKALVDLHGSLDRVQCISCENLFSRQDIQEWLELNNPQLHEALAIVKPDGDADIADELISSIRVPECENCGGILKPDVVFFGGTVPRTRIHTINEALGKSDGLLVVGSSLKVFSGFRICRDTHQAGKPIACLTQGVTRADDMISLKIEADCESSLAETAKLLGLACD